MRPNYPLTETSRPLPWQRENWERTQLAFAGNRLAHASLLTGTQGSGRNAFALALARTLLCEAPLTDGNCGQCKSCELSRRGAHPDFHALLPAEEGKAIGIDAVRRTMSFAATTSSISQRKVILVTPLEGMTISAFNAFLKSLEEPADNTYFLLVHARGHRLPATIRSRCQQLVLTDASETAAADWLRDALGGKNDVAIDALLALTGGQPLAALALAEGDNAESLLTLHQTLRAVLDQRNSTPALGAAAAVEPLLLLQQIDAVLHDAMLTRAQQNDGHGLRSAIAARDRVEGLRGAQLSGSNPNADLLRFTALEELAAACEGPGRDAKLGAT